MDISVVIPVLNEEESLPHLLDRMTAVLSGTRYQCEMVFVDDGSRDRSLEILKTFKASSTGGIPIKIVKLARNFGQHPATIAGFAAASGRILVTFDADLQNEPADILKLVEKIEEGYDFVSGIRGFRTDSVWLRQLPSYLFTRLLNIVTKKKLKDYGCPLNALRSEIAVQMREYGDMQRYLKPLATRLAPRIAEMPVAHYPRVRGASRYTMLDLIDLFFDFLTNFSRRVFQRVAIAGCLLTFVSLVLGFVCLVASLAFGSERVSPVGAGLVALLLLIAGIEFLVLGVLGDFVVRVYQKVESKPIYRVERIFD